MLVNRVGTFFLLVGVFLLVLFAVSTQVQRGGTPAFLLVGLLSFFLGAILWWRGPRQPSQPSGRFRMLREARNKKGGKKSGGKDKENRSGREERPPRT